MTGYELKALRRFFFLDVVDAANYIGKCSVRAWQYWEKGNRKVPLDVINIMMQLKEERQELLSALSKNNSFNDFKSDDLIYSRLIASVKAELLAKNIFKVSE
jgi:hypothetical protein